MMSSLMAVLGLDVAPFKRGVMEAQADARKAGKDFKEAFGEMIASNLPFASAAGAATALEEMVRRSIEWGDKVDETSKRLGISTDAVQLWDAALRKSGSSIESATGFFEKLAVSREKALKGSDKEIDSFKRLGVSIDDLKTKRIEDIATSIASAFETGDPQKLVSDLRAVGGKSAGEMVPAFADGLGDAVNPEKSDTWIVSEEKIAMLSMAADTFSDIWTNVKGIGASFTGELIKGVYDLAHDARVVIGMIIGEISGTFGALGDGISKAFKGDVKGAAGSFSGMFAEGHKRAMEYGQAVDDMYKLEEAKGKETREKLQKSRAEGLEEIDTNKRAKEAEKVAEEILRIENETARIKEEAALKEMTAAERVAWLRERIKRIEGEIEFAVDDKDEAQSRRNLAKREAELSKAEQDAKKEADQAAKKDKAGNRYHAPEVNSLQRIGAYVSPQEGMKTIAEKSEAHLATMREQLTELVKNSRNTRF